MRHIPLILATACVATLFATAGCTKPAGPTPAGTLTPTTESGAPDSGSAGTIGFSALELKNPFFKIIADGITAEGEEHGFSVIVNDAERDVNEQSKHIDNYIAQNVSAIIINPADRIAIGPAVKKANEAGIPVFTCDLQCVAEDATIAGHIGTDNLGGGRLAGEAMVEALGDAGGEVLVLHFKQANSCILRVQGFTEVVDAHNEGRQSGRIEVVAELDGGGLKDEGFRAAADALQAHPSLRGIFAINDPSGLGAWTALKEVDRTDQVTIVAFDGQIEGKQAILEGKIYADPIQFPKKMAAASVHNIIKYINGEKYNEMELIPTAIYKKADAEVDPELQGSAASESADDTATSDSSE